MSWQLNETKDPVITAETCLELKTTTTEKKQEEEEEGEHPTLTPNSLFTSIVSGV